MSRVFGYDGPGGVSTDTMFGTAPLSSTPSTAFGWAFLPETPVGTGYDERCLTSIANDGTFNQFIGIGVGEGTGYRIVARNTTYISTQVPTPPTYDAWHAICGVFASATDRRVYGAAPGDTAWQTASDTTSVSVPGTLDRLGIGILADNSPNQGLGGNAAHIAWWNVALSEDEISMLVLGRVSPLMVRPGNLVFYAPFLGRNATDIDIIGRRNLTVSGATASTNEPPMLWLPQQRKIFLPPAITSVTLDADPGNFRFTGGDADLLADRRLPVAPGALQFAGGAVDLSRNRRLQIDAADFRIAGGAVGLPLGRVLLAGAGELRFAGAAVSLEAQRRLQAAAADYRFQGQPVDFSRAYRIAVAAGDFRLLGGAVAFGADRSLGVDSADFRFAGGAVDFAVLGDDVFPVEPGEFALQGGVVGLRASRRLAADAGAFSFAGGDAETLAQRRLAIAPGAFTFAGAAVDLIAEQEIAFGIEAGAFTLAGASVSLHTLRRLSADAGALTFTGGAAELSRDRVLKASAGHFSLRGGRVRLDYSGAPPATGADRGGVTGRITTSITERVIA